MTLGAPSASLFTAETLLSPQLIFLLTFYGNSQAGVSKDHFVHVLHPPQWSGNYHSSILFINSPETQPPWSLWVPHASGLWLLLTQGKQSFKCERTIHLHLQVFDYCSNRSNLAFSVPFIIHSLCQSHVSWRVREGPQR